MVPVLFFRLPGELRNQIYEHVLTSTEALHFVPNGRREKPMIVDNYSEFNQLKYVSHAFYKEIAGLEAKFNIVEFHGNFPKEHGPAKKFNTFIQGCAPSKASWFTKVILRSHFDPGIGRLGRSLQADFPKAMSEHSLEPSADLIPVAKFCREHPSICIRYIVGGFHCLPAFPLHFLFVGAYLSMAIYHKDIRRLRRRSDPLIFPWSRILGATRHASTNGVAQLKVPNLRFFPAQSEIKQGDFIRWLSLLSFQQWMPVMEDWIENGI